MNYKQLLQQVSRATGVAKQVQCFNHIVEEAVDGSILVDHLPTQFSCLEEAREYIRQQKLTNDIRQQLQETISDNKVANIIKEQYGDIKVTDTLVASYVELASSKLFTTDTVVRQIREQTDIRTSSFGKIDFVLSDGSAVAIDPTTLDIINNTFGQHSDVIDYMRESVENFLDVVNQIED